MTYPTHQRESPVTMSVSGSSQDAWRTRGLTAGTQHGEQLIANQNPAQSDSEAEHCSNTNDDWESNQAKTCAQDKNKPASSSGSMKPPELSDHKPNNKIPIKKRPHSATAGAGNAVTTTSGECNQYASANTLASKENSINTRSYYHRTTHAIAT